MKAKIFVSGTLREDFLADSRRMILYAEEVESLGGVVCYVPCLDMLRSLCCGCKPTEEYHARDLEWLEVCDAVALVPGSNNKTPGVMGEKAKAKDLNKPILKNLVEVRCFLETFGK